MNKSMIVKGIKDDRLNSEEEIKIRLKTTMFGSKVWSVEVCSLRP